ncbi:MAG TPA: polymer-forming cytoskeletal protein [Gemmatimonadaceae bacterium]|nr:polymer-forming cytoskeletal protein [Gemmatimonadaceae bacterium]
MAIFSKDVPAGEGTRDASRASSIAAGTSLSIIAAGTVIDGDITTEGVIRIEGRVQGSVRAGRQVLVGRQGEVQGDVTTREAVVGGKVQGAITASERLEVQGTSTIIGDITTKAIAVIEGGKINGTVRISDAREAGAGQGTPSVAVVR